MFRDMQLIKMPSVRKAKKAILNAFKYQKLNKGTCFIEIIGNCPSNWKMTPVEANKFIDEEMVKTFPLGDIKVFKTKIYKFKSGRSNLNMFEEIIIAGFGGQGVLSMGMTLLIRNVIEE